MKCRGFKLIPLLLIAVSSMFFMSCLDNVAGLEIIPDYTYGMESNDSSLKFLKVPGYDLSPSFSPDTYEYSIEVVATVTDIDVVAIASDTATIQIDGAAITSSTKKVILASEIQDVVIDVTAENGHDTLQYVITVTRVLDPTEARLYNLAVSEGVLTPSFDPDNGDYSVTVSYGSSTIAVTPTAMNPNATITVDGAAVDSGNNAAVDISGLPADGSSTQNINIHIVSEDGFSTEDYTITVTKTIAPVCDGTGTNAYLSNIEISYGSGSSCRLYGFNSGDSNFIPGAISFDRDTMTYAIVVYGYSSISITATAEDPCVSVLSISGSGSPTDGITTRSVSLTQNVVTDIPIVVTSEDGMTTNTYTIKARLLNIYEMYYGIYGPPARDNKTEWYAANPDPFPGDDFTFTGSISGSMHWVISWIQVLVSVRNQMTFDNYNNGGHGYAYCEDGYAQTGVMSAEVNTSGNGYQTGTVELYSRWGDHLATLELHLKLTSKVPVSATDSYTTITYMGQTVQMMYLDVPNKESLAPADWHPGTPWTSGDF